MFQSLIALLSLFCFLASPLWAAEEPLEAEQAFRFSARAIDHQTIELRYRIADGYYLYKNKFQFSAGPGVQLGKMKFPAARIKEDEFFGKVETYRGQLILPIAVQSSKAPLELTVTAQGCADLGLCYPPFSHTAKLKLPVVAEAASIAQALPPATSPSAIALPLVPHANPTVEPTGPVDETAAIGSLFQRSSVGLMLSSFFGFGLLLAFTPCVFPMIPILSGIIVGHGCQISKRRAFLLSLAYVLGMAVTYTLAGVAAGLSGALLSAALQNPWVLGAFALLFVALSLSMFGLYELQLPASLQSRLSDSANRRQGGSLIGVTLMGALSALIVGPCVAAPLAGALLYIAQTRDALLGGAALFAMALGMGAPLILVGVAARSALPKAGGWMEGVKKCFGVLLLAVALWLVSPVLPSYVLMLACAALLIFSGIFLHALDPLPVQAAAWPRLKKGLGVIGLLAGVALFVGVLGGSRNLLQPLSFLRAEAAAAAPAKLRFERVTTLAELDAKLQAAYRPVLLDFYADWCVSCKEMEHLTFADPAVQARLEKMQLLQVDVTANSAADKAMLQRFQLFGPPAIVFFNRNGQELPQRRVVGFQAPATFAPLLDRLL